MDRAYKSKKTTVQLTSLLDLLFVMIFVSLIQQKEITRAPEKPAVKPITKVKPQPKPVKKNFSVQATFHFYGTKTNPNIPSGKYLMQGNYNTDSGKLQLGGIGWLERPANYDMVPLSGTIQSGSDIFTGRIEFIGCKKFTLERKVKKNNSPISGEWVGTYDCSQGETGLTLSVK
jgi:hypothetical protein